MYLVNTFGRVVDIPDDQADYKIRKRKFREATRGEVAAFLAHQADTSESKSSVYFSTVSNTSDGYGMSRQHMKEQLALLDIKLSENFTGQKVGLLYNYPYGVVNMRSDVRLIYTMFESSRIPDDWIEYLKAADQVLVPSRWCQAVFKRSGIESVVVPLGYNDAVFKPVDRDEERPYTFLHYDSFNLRKGFQEVFEAFTQEFTANDDVRLVLKTVHKQTPFPILKSQYAQIDVIKEDYTEQELADLLRQADCMVYPSRGEGFGLTPLEAMATGLPAIVPNAHGISEYFNEDYMLEVEASGRCPGLVNRFRGQDIGEMVICDVDDLRKKMRYAYEHQDKMREMGQKASEYVKRYTYRNTAQRLAEIIRKWQETNVVKRGDSKFLKVEVM